MTIDFGAACKDLFTTEKKWMTLLLLSVCVLIPVVGMMVAMGYLFRRYAGVRAGIPAADFDFSFFGEHLQAGLWPVVSGLVASLVVIPVIILAMLPMMLGPALFQDNEAMMFLCMGVGMILYVAVLVAMTMILIPIQLRSGLMMDFKAGFSKAFIIDFIKKVGGSMLLWYVVLMIVVTPLALLGYLALFVGVYVVMAWAQVTWMHLLFQHYDLYLERGGQAIPVNPALLTVLAPPTPPTAPPTAPPTLPIS